MKRTYNEAEIIPAIREFIAHWADAQFTWFSKVKDDYVAWENDHKATTGSRHGHDEWTTYAWFKQRGISKSLVSAIRYSSPESWKKLIEDDGKLRALRLQYKVEEKAGEITDAKLLTLNPNGGFDGVVVGTKATVRIETIFAGGYNIQCLHYRTLVHVIK